MLTAHSLTPVTVPALRRANLGEGQRTPDVRCRPTRPADLRRRLEKRLSDGRRSSLESPGLTTRSEIRRRVERARVDHASSGDVAQATVVQVSVDAEACGWRCRWRGSRQRGTQWHSGRQVRGQRLVAARCRGRSQFAIAHARHRFGAQCSRRSGSRAGRRCSARGTVASFSANTGAEVLPRSPEVRRARPHSRAVEEHRPSGQRGRVAPRSPPARSARRCRASRRGTPRSLRSGGQHDRCPGRPRSPVTLPGTWSPMSTSRSLSVIRACPVARCADGGRAAERPAPDHRRDTAPAPRPGRCPRRRSGRDAFSSSALVAATPEPRSRPLPRKVIR